MDYVLSLNLLIVVSLIKSVSIILVPIGFSISHSFHLNNVDLFLFIFLIVFRFWINFINYRSNIEFNNLTKASVMINIGVQRAQEVDLSTVGVAQSFADPREYRKLIEFNFTNFNKIFPQPS